MTIIVRDTGFSTDDWHHPFLSADALSPEKTGSTAPFALDLGTDCDVLNLPALPKNVRMVRVTFPAFTDGRGFTIARLLRLKGYRGVLRARGNLLADQYTMLRRCGFDEAEISDDLAHRQPEDQWRARSDWQARDYQTGLRQFV